MAKVIAQENSRVGADCLLVDPEIPMEQIIHVASDIPKTEDIIFINNRDPSGILPLEFHYHSKTHPLKRYKLLNGKKYTLPIEIIEHLEGQKEIDPYSCHKREYAERQGLYGTELYVTNYISYFQCRRVRS